MVTDAELSEVRQSFEDKVYWEYFSRGIKFKSGKQFAEITNTLTKIQLCERDEVGAYKDEHVDAMWFGFKLALGFTTK